MCSSLDFIFSSPFLFVVLDDLGGNFFYEFSSSFFYMLNVVLGLFNFPNTGICTRTLQDMDLAICQGFRHYSGHCDHLQAMDLRKQLHPKTVQIFDKIL